jgi:hypothetical protein
MSKNANNDFQGHSSKKRDYAAEKCADKHPIHDLLSRVGRQSSSKPFHPHPSETVMKIILSRRGRELI